MEVIASKRKHFTHVRKQLIVKEHFSTGISIPVLARKYDIHAITLYGWKRNMNQKKDQSEIDPEFIKKLIEENDRPKKSDIKSTTIDKEIKAHQRYEDRKN